MRHVISMRAFVCALAAVGCGEVEDGEVPLVSATKLLIEHNGTDLDTGFQGFVDGDPWDTMSVRGPDGSVVLEVMTRGGLAGFGLTELFFETHEPANDEVAIDEVLERLGSGTYTAAADMVDGPGSSRTTTLSHAIPAPPVLTTPADGATGLDPSGVSVSWQPVTNDLDGDPIDVVAYEVIVEEDAPPCTRAASRDR